MPQCRQRRIPVGTAAGRLEAAAEFGHRLQAQMQTGALQAVRHIGQFGRPLHSPFYQLPHGLQAASGIVHKQIHQSGQLFGLAADKLNLKVGLWIAMTLVLTAFLMMASEPGYPLMLLAAGLLGLATGGMLPVWGSLMARVFGLLSYGRAMGLMGPLITLLVMPGFAVVGRLYDASGSYRLGLVLFAGVTVLAMLILLPLKLAPTAAQASHD